MMQCSNIDIINCAYLASIDWHRKYFIDGPVKYFASDKQENILFPELVGKDELEAGDGANNMVIYGGNRKTILNTLLLQHKLPSS